MDRFGNHWRHGDGGFALLKRRKPLRAKKGLRPYNPERRARDHVKNFGDGPFKEFTWRQPCCTCGDSGRSQESHVLTRGAHPHSLCIIPQCYKCHHELEQHGIDTFEEKHGVDLMELAREHWLAWEIHQKGEEIVATWTTCPKCKGSGRIGKSIDMCWVCEGSGQSDFVELEPDPGPYLDCGEE